CHSMCLPVAPATFTSSCAGHVDHGQAVQLADQVPAGATLPLDALAGGAGHVHQLVRRPRRP
ncbi:hypothetical protein, partial [Pseudoduganella ginsengisoli]